MEPSSFQGEQDRRSIEPALLAGSRLQPLSRRELRTVMAALRLWKDILLNRRGSRTFETRGLDGDEIEALIRRFRVTGAFNT